MKEEIIQICKYSWVLNNPLTITGGTCLQKILQIGSKWHCHLWNTTPIKAEYSFILMHRGTLTPVHYDMIQWKENRSQN